MSRKRRTKRLESQRGPVQAELQEGNAIEDHDENHPPNNGGSFVVRDRTESQIQVEVSHDLMGLDALLQQGFPASLHPHNNIPAFTEMMRAVNGQRSPEGFVPLISKDQIAHLFEITFNEMISFYPIFDLPALNRLNAEQHALSSTHPAGNPARWAIINIWIALGTCIKVSPTRDDEVDCIIKAYYRNAVLVLPDLILQPANKETISALLFMSVYAEAALDQRSHVMLVTNAVRQIELLIPRLSEALDQCELDACRPGLAFARLQDMKLANKYGITQLLGSLGI